MNSRTSGRGAELVQLMPSAAENIELVKIRGQKNRGIKTREALRWHQKKDNLNHVGLFLLFIIIGIINAFHKHLAVVDTICQSALKQGLDACGICHT